VKVAVVRLEETNVVEVDDTVAVDGGARVVAGGEQPIKRPISMVVGLRGNSSMPRRKTRSGRDAIAVS
jgi:hypothetical protein